MHLMTRQRARELIRRIWGSGRVEMTTQEKREVATTCLALGNEELLDVLQRVAQDNFNWRSADLKTRTEHFANLN